MDAILHLIETGGPGGAEHVFLQIATTLNHEGYSSIVAVGRDGWLAGQARGRGLNVEILSATGSLSVTYLRQLTETISRNKIKLVLAHMFGAAVYSGLAHMLTGVPVVGVFHGQSDIAAKERLLFAKKMAIKFGCSRVVFVSEALQDSLRPHLGLPAEQCAVVENGIDLERFTRSSSSSFRQSLGLPSNAMLVGSVGNVRPTKGYETLLKAAQPICITNSRVHFLIAGDTSGNTFPEIQELQRSMNLCDRVHFLGLRDDVEEVLANIDVFVLSSRTEGFSLALVEAMASGCAAIATRSGGPEGIIVDGETGILVPVDDPTLLSKSIERLLEDADFRVRLGKSGKQSISNRFSAQRMANDYLHLIRAILKS